MQIKEMQSFKSKLKVYTEKKERDNEMEIIKFIKYRFFKTKQIKS